MQELSPRHRELFAEIDSLRDLIDATAAQGDQPTVEQLISKLHGLLREVDHLPPLPRSQVFRNGRLLRLQPNQETHRRAC
jgi:hypothetical protein